MAKNQDPKVGAAKGKMTVLLFQLEGGDNTLLEAIKVMGQGIEKMSPSAPIYKVLQAPSQSRINGVLPPGGHDAVDPAILDADEDGTDPEDSPSGSSSSEKPQRVRKPPKAIPAVKGIDWDSETPWKDYADQKKPDGNPQRFVTVAGWFKNFRGLDVITPGHIIAAFDVMDWDKPENIANTFAQIKQKRAGELFDKGEKTNEWILSQRGVNLLDRLGKAKAK